MRLLIFFAPRTKARITPISRVSTVTRRSRSPTACSRMISPSVVRRMRSSLPGGAGLPAVGQIILHTPRMCKDLPVIGFSFHITASNP